MNVFWNCTLICRPHFSAILLLKLTDTHEEFGATEKNTEDQDPDCVINDQYYNKI